MIFFFGMPVDQFSLQRRSSRLLETTYMFRIYLMEMFKSLTFGVIETYCYGGADAGRGFVCIRMNEADRRY